MAKRPSQARRGRPAARYGCRPRPPPPPSFGRERRGRKAGVHLVEDEDLDVRLGLFLFPEAVEVLQARVDRGEQIAARLLHQPLDTGESRIGETLPQPVGPTNEIARPMGRFDSRRPCVFRRPARLADRPVWQLQQPRSSRRRPPTRCEPIPLVPRRRGLRVGHLHQSAIEGRKQVALPEGLPVAQAECVQNLPPRHLTFQDGEQACYLGGYLGGCLGGRESLRESPRACT